MDRGELYVTGRIKDLIIIRGRNYYPQDLEAAVDGLADLLRPGAQAAFAIAGEEQESVVLISEVQRDAYRKFGSETVFAAMRQALAGVCDLPDMTLVLVSPGAVPKTSSGKIRRRACRDAFLAGTLAELARSGAPTAAETELQSVSSDGGPAGSPLAAALRVSAAGERSALLVDYLLGAVAGVLRVGRDQLSPDLPLRAFGLDSLRLVELQHALEQLLDADIALADLLAETPVTELAARLAALPGRAPGEPTGASAAGVSDSVALSYAQRAMWTVQRLAPDGIGYNLHLALRLTGAFEPERFGRALQRVGQVHPVLRTVYLEEGSEPVQRIGAADQPIGFELVDTGGWSTDRLQQDLTARARRPFPLSSLPLARATVYRLEMGDHLLLLCAHHIALDLWSLLIVLHDARAAYSGDAFPLLPAAAPYRAFVDWQRDYLASDRSARDWDYWRQRLEGPLPVLALPQDQPGDRAASSRGASARLDLDPVLSARLTALARDHGATLFALLLAAYKVLLSRYAGQSDLIVGVPSGGRVQSRFAGTVGNFVNPLPIRSFPAPHRAFAEFLGEVRDTVLAGIEHQDFPFPLLVERLAPERHADRWPVYQTWFVLQQAQSPFDADAAQLALGEDGPAFDWGPWSARSVALTERVENFELKLMAAAGKQGLSFSFQYRTDLFSAGTIARLAANFGQLLSAIAADPTQRLAALPLLADRERASVLNDWNATVCDYGPQTTVPRLFHGQVARSPDAPALEFGDTVLSYRELAARVRQLAARLRARGVGPETVVAICAHRSVELVLGLLAILEAGGAYLPLEPDYPPQRLAGMVEDAGARLVLIQPSLAESLRALPGEKLSLAGWESIEAADHGEAPGSVPQPGHLAYVLYTSGSTGKPKGVGVPHRGLVNRLWWMQQCFRLDAGDAVLQKTPYGFDVSVWEFFWPLLNGARLVIAAPEAHRDAEELAAMIERHRITTVHFVPSMLRAFLETPGLGRCGTLRRIVCSGEALTPDLRDRCFERLDAELHNLYGPTEASIDVS
ncbi:MAG: AMP-binding protein, partial [Gammaproteobacteria bacterium]|nr:AMP-binding protein [Gammaproteobacteria bacterium]